MEKIAHIFSFILHPALIPTIVFSLIVVYAPSAVTYLSLEGKKTFIWLIFISTYLFPLFMVLLNSFLRHNKLSVEGLYMRKAKDRVLPFLFTGIIYTGITYLLYDTQHLNTVIYAIMACISITVLCLALINIFWKISAHAAGIIGAIVYLIDIQIVFPDNLLFIPTIILIFLAGIVISSRMFLQEHTPMQIVGGVVLGIASGLGAFMLLN
ncbi:MAG TPA: phosphatase PAP2 family protein [Cytophagaceae bacterium]